MSITVYTEDNARTVDDPEKFKTDFHLIKAAGGAVTDDEGRILLIYRKGKWDLPKGKLEDNEPIELCADREVKEETGLTELELRKADLEVMGMVSIFNYGFSAAKEAFEKASVTFYSLTNYPTMISLAIEKGIVTPEQEGVLLKWQENPSIWRGF